MAYSPGMIERLLAPILVLVLGLPAWSQDILSPRMLNERSYSETYTAIADLEGDQYLQVQVGVSNLGLSKGRGGCRLLLLEKDELVAKEEIKVDRDDWAYHAGETSRLDLGRCALSRGATTVFTGSFDAMSVTLTLDGSSAPVRPPSGRIEVGDAFYESDVMAPWAAATLQIGDERDGGRTLQGFGYADHSRSTTLPAKLASRWFRFRGLAESGSLLVLARFPPRSKGETPRPDGWIWAQGQAAPVALRDLTLERVGDDDTAWRVSAESVNGEVYALFTERPIYRLAPVEDQGFLGRMLKGVIGNPVTRTFRAIARRGVGSGTGLAGIAEVTIVAD